MVVKKKVITTEEDETKTKPCTDCTRKKAFGQFYVSDSPYDKDGRMNVCKICLKKNIDYNDLDTIKAVLITMNRPFLFYAWESAIEESNKTGKDLFGSYCKNVMFNFKDLTWKDSVFKPTSNQMIDSEPQFDDTKQVITLNNEFRLTDAIVNKWGEGYTPEEYSLFEKKWKKLIDNYGEKTSLHTEGLITYIRFRVKEEISTSKGLVKDAKEWGTMASNAAKDARLNVSQLSKSDISGGVDLMSQLYEAVESEVGIIPLLPKLLDQPYDDADMVIWSIVNYTRRLEDKPSVPYRDIWTFYDEMLQEHFTQLNFSKDQIKKFKENRKNIFRDLSEVYKEPLYEGDE